MTALRPRAPACSLGQRRRVAEVVGEREVRDAERVAHAEGLGQLARDALRLPERPPDADVHFSEQEQVGIGERRSHDDTSQIIEPRPTRLDVPGHGPQASARRRSPGATATGA